MESRYTIHILPAEWRWVILVSVLLVLLAFAPFLWVAVTDTSDWQFMGALHNFRDGATYLAKMVQGEQGQWLVRFQHTPEDYPGVFLQAIYPALGHLARLTGLPSILLFHVARVGAALFMYLSLYYLSACIWQRVRTRRIFFVLAAVGSGAGWLLVLLEGAVFSGLDASRQAPDLTIPEMFPFYSTLMNVHFPLAIGCLGFLGGMLISVCRPGARETGVADIGVVFAGLLAIALAILYPQALVPLVVGYVAYLVVTYLKTRRVSRRGIRWLLAITLPALPFAAYYLAVVSNIPALAEWNRQNMTTAPSPLYMLAGVFLPLVLALPAILRAARGLEADDDRFMLMWLLAMLVLMYLPTNIQRRFSAGLMLPLAYFATRAIEDFWFRYVPRQRRRLALFVILPLLVVSHLLILFLPVLPAVTGQPQRAVGIFLEREYVGVYRWLDARTRSSDVVLAAPLVSLWLPGWAGARVVYAHEYETLDAERKEAAVEAWYAAEAGENCAALLQRYDVKFVLYGPEERQLGAGDCLATLHEVVRLGQVSIYAP